MRAVPESVINCVACLIFEAHRTGRREAYNYLAGGIRSRKIGGARLAAQPPAACLAYLQTAGEQNPLEIRYLLAEFMKYLLRTAVDSITRRSCRLKPSQDSRTGWQQSGQVGQQVYGSAAAFLATSRAQQRLRSWSGINEPSDREKGRACGMAKVRGATPVRHLPTLDRGAILASFCC